MENDQEYSDSSRTYFKKDLMPNTYMFLALQISRKKAKYSLILSLNRLTQWILSARVFKTEIGDLRNCASATTPLRWGQGVYFLAFFWFNGSLLLPHSCHESVHSIIQIQQKNLSTSLRLSKKLFPRSNLCQDIKWVCFRQAQVNLWETGSFSCISHLQSFSKAVYVMFIHISQDGKGLVNNQLLAQN